MPYTPTWKNVGAPNFGGTIVGLNRSTQQIAEGFSGLGSVFNDYIKRRQTQTTNDAIKNLMTASPDERQDLLKQYDQDSWVDSKTIFDAVGSLEQRERLARQDERAAEKFELEKEELERQAQERTAFGMAFDDDNQITRDDIAQIRSQYPDIDITPLLNQIAKEEDQAMQRQKFNLDVAKERYAAEQQLYTAARNRAASQAQDMTAWDKANPPPTFNPFMSAGAPQSSVGAQTETTQGVGTSWTENAVQRSQEPEEETQINIGANEEVALQQLQQLDQFDPTEAAALAEPMLQEARRMDMHDAQIAQGTRLYKNAKIVKEDDDLADDMRTKGMDLIEGNIAAKYRGVPTAIVAAAEGLNETVNVGRHIVTAPDGTVEINPAVEAELARIGERVTTLNEDMDFALRQAGVSYDDRVKMKSKMMKDLGYEDAMQRYEDVRDRVQKSIDEVSVEKRDTLKETITTENKKLIGAESRKNFEENLEEDIRSAHSVKSKVMELFKNNPPPVELVQNVMVDFGGIQDGLVNDAYVFYGTKDVTGTKAAPYIALKVLNEAERINDATGGGVVAVSRWLDNFKNTAEIENLRTALYGRANDPTEEEIKEDAGADVIESVQPEPMRTRGSIKRNETPAPIEFPFDFSQPVPGGTRGQRKKQ